MRATVRCRRRASLRVMSEEAHGGYDVRPPRRWPRRAELESDRRIIPIAGCLTATASSSARPRPIREGWPYVIVVTLMATSRRGAPSAPPTTCRRFRCTDPPPLDKVLEARAPRPACGSRVELPARGPRRAVPRSEFSASLKERRSARPRRCSCGPSGAGKQWPQSCSRHDVRERRRRAVRRGQLRRSPADPSRASSSATRRALSPTPAPRRACQTADGEPVSRLKCSPERPRRSFEVSSIFSAESAENGNRRASRSSPRRIRRCPDGRRAMAKLFHRISAFRSPSRVARATRRHPGPRKPSSIFAQRVKKRVSGLSRGARDKLVQYEYPGNVRELRNIVERAVILTRAQEIQLDDIVLPRTESAAHGNYPAFFSVDLKLDGDPPTAEQIEQAYVKRDLDYYAGKRTQAAQALGVSYPTFLRRLRELGLDE